VSQTKVQSRTRPGGAPKPTDVVFANDQWVVTGDGLYRSCVRVFH
jgi:hypothetical protein